MLAVSPALLVVLAGRAAAEAGQPVGGRLGVLPGPVVPSGWSDFRVGQAGFRSPSRVGSALRSVEAGSGD